MRTSDWKLHLEAALSLSEADASELTDLLATPYAHCSLMTLAPSRGLS
jgi:hypothetical protein